MGIVKSRERKRKKKSLEREKAKLGIVKSPGPTFLKIFMIVPFK